jgi:hypothetical protein
MALTVDQETTRRRLVHRIESGGWVVALVLVSVASLVGFLVVVTTETGPFFQHPQAVVLMLIAVAGLLGASIVGVAATMKRRTRSRLPSLAEATAMSAEPATCAMGAEHLDVFSARMCDIGSIDDACVIRLEKIATDHPDRATRQQTAERLKSHRAWNEESSAVPSASSTGRH